MAKVVQAKKRRLGDLFHVGHKVEIDDGFGDPIELYMRRPNPFEHEEALRDGNSARARIALKMRDPKTEDYDILEADIVAIGNMEARRKFLVEEQRQDLMTRAYGELSELPEWKDEKLILETQQNVNKWTNAEPALDEEHEDWDDFQRALGVLGDFEKALEEKTETLSGDALVKLREEDDGEITERCRRILIDRAAGLHFFRDYRISCLYYGTRDPEERVSRYFTSKMEIRELPYEVQTKLLAEYDKLDLPREEVKNLPSAVPSLEESAQPEQLETSEFSGQEVATV